MALISSSPIFTSDNRNHRQYKDGSVEKLAFFHNRILNYAENQSACPSHIHNVSHLRNVVTIPNTPTPSLFASSARIIIILSYPVSYGRNMLPRRYRLLQGTRARAKCSVSYNQKVSIPRSLSILAALLLSLPTPPLLVVLPVFPNELYINAKKILPSLSHSPSRP